MVASLVPLFPAFVGPARGSRKGKRAARRGAVRAQPSYPARNPSIHLATRARSSGWPRLATARAAEEYYRTRLLPQLQDDLAAVEKLFLAAQRFAVGLFIGGLLPAANALVGRLVSRAERGAVYGMTSSAMFLGNSLGPLLGGASPPPLVSTGCS